MHKKQKVTEILPHQFHRNCGGLVPYFIF